MSNREKKQNRRDKRKEVAKFKAAVREDEREIARLMGVQEESERAIAALRGNIKQLDQERERLGKNIFIRYLKAVPLALLGIAFIAVGAWVLAVRGPDWDSTNAVYTVLAGVLAVASLTVAFVDGEPYEKNTDTGPLAQIWGAIKTVFSKDGLNLTGIVLSLLSAGFLLATTLVS